MLLDPVISKVLSSGEFSVGGLGGAGGVGGAGAGAGGNVAAGGFGKALQGAIDGLSNSLAEAGSQSQKLVTGEAQDVAQVTMAVERAVLELQLASQVRNKAVEAYQELFRMQV